MVRRFASGRTVPDATRAASRWIREENIARPTLRSEAERDEDMLVPRVHADPVLQPEQQPQHRKCSHEDDRVQEGGNSAVFNRWKKVQWSTLPFLCCLGAFINQELERGIS